MITIETNRLLLRNYRAADFEDIMDYFSDEEVSKFEDFYPMSEEQVRNIITEWQDMDNRLVAELKSNRKVIGSIGGRALVQYLFESVGIRAVYGDCDVRNISSWKLLERLGFQRIKKLDNQSYKNDQTGNPILISTFLYELESSREDIFPTRRAARML